VTVHVQDLTHASPQPAGTGGRRTMYVTHYPPTLWDHVGPGQALTSLARQAKRCAVASLGTGDEVEGMLTALGALWSKLPRGVRYSRSKSVSGHDRSKYALVGWYNRKYANQFLPATVGIQFDS